MAQAEPTGIKSPIDLLLRVQHRPDITCVRNWLLRERSLGARRHMRKLAIWQMSNDTLARLDEVGLEVERRLEDWIAAAPELLQEGLVIVGRQVQLDSGPLDLLALDPQGRWVVIEIKRGALDRKSVAQVIDYAACLAETSAEELRAKIEPYLTSTDMDLDELLRERGVSDAIDPDQRQVLLLIAGAGKADGLERVVRFLGGQHNMPIRIVSFNVFGLEKGSMLLAREVTDHDSAGDPFPLRRPGLTVDSVLALARKHGTDTTLRRAVEFAKSCNLHIRPWKTSLMFTPSTNKSRMLFTLWAKPEKGGLKAYIGIEPFTEFFALTRTEVQKRLGSGGWQTLKPADFEKLIQGLQDLDLGGRELKEQ